MSAFINLRPGFARWQSALLLTFLGLALLAPATLAKHHGYQLPDGVNVDMDVQTNQTLITLSGESKSVYRLEYSTDLQVWTILDNRMKLNASGIFTYTDARTLPKCFYRITILHVP
jgi:hypothetical protein